MRGKPVVLIRVEESKVKPVMFRGRAYKRVGNTTRQMSLEELTRVILDSVGATWDEVPDPRATLRDIDPAQVKRFVRLANEEGRRPIPRSISAGDLLAKLDLLKGKQLTRAAVLLFAKRPQKFHLQAMIKAGRFRPEGLIVDDREIEGTLWDQVEGAMNYFRERLQTRFEITGRPQRTVIWEYPLEALREAVTNAVCHRDYLSSGHTQIRIYDERLSVWNPGALPGGLSIEMLKKEHASKPRNRLIAKVFFYAGLIEQWGSGIDKMLRETRNLDLPEPIFEEADGFKVTFSNAAIHQPAKPARDGQATAQVTAQGTAQVTAQVEKLLKAASREPLSREELQNILNLNHREHFRKAYLKPLLDKGWLEATIPGKPLSPLQRYRTTPAGLALSKKRRQ